MAGAAEAAGGFVELVRISAHLSLHIAEEAVEEEWNGDAVPTRAHNTRARTRGLARQAITCATAPCTHTNSLALMRPGFTVPICVSCLSTAPSGGAMILGAVLLQVWMSTSTPRRL